MTQRAVGRKGWGTRDTISNKVKVTGSDTTADFLSPSITAGANITLTILNPGADESLQIESSGGTVVAALQPHGSMYVTTAVTNAANGTPAKLAGAGVTAANLLSNFTHQTPNRLTYVGAATQDFEILVSYTATHTAPNTTLSFYIAVDGAVIPNSRIDRKVGSGGDIGAAPLSWQLNLAQNQFVEIWSDADNAGTTTIFFMTPVIHGLAAASGTTNDLIPYEQVWVPANAMTPSIASGDIPTALTDQLAARRQCYDVLEMAAGVSQYAFWTMAFLRKELKSSPDFVVYPLFYQSADATAPANKNVIFNIAAFNANPGSSLNVDIVTGEVSIQIDAEDIHVVAGGDDTDTAKGAQIDLQGDAISDSLANFITFGIWRRGDIDNYANTIRFLGCIVQWKTDWANLSIIPA